MAQRGDGLAFVQPSRQDLGDEVEVLRKLGAEEALTVEPKRVHAHKQSGLIWWHRGAWIEECEEASCYFALEEPEVGCGCGY